MAEKEIDEVAGEVAATPADEEKPYVKSTRDLMLDQLGEARDQDVMTEAGVESEEVEPAPEGREEQDEDADPSERAPEKIKVKVDGEEFDVSEEQIRDRLGLEGRKIQPSDIRNFQKHVSADRRLAQVAEERRNLEAREAALLAREAAISEKANAEAPAESSEDEAAQALYESLILGDEESGVGAVKKLLSKRENTVAPDVNAIAQQAADLAQRRIDWAAAQAEFSKDFHDLVSDPLLAQIADNTLQETLKTSRTYSEAFHKAGDATRQWLGTVSGKPPSKNGSTTPDDSFADKRAKKEALARAVVQSAGGGQEAPRRNTKKPQRKSSLPCARPEGCRFNARLMPRGSVQLCPVNFG